MGIVVFGATGYTGRLTVQALVASGQEPTLVGRDAARLNDLAQAFPGTRTAVANADALIWAIMTVFALALLLLPFIPGLRALPRRLGVYRLIWREYYRSNPR